MVLNLGKDYPLPIVNHQKARLRAIDFSKKSNQVFKNLNYFSNTFVEAAISDARSASSLVTIPIR